MPRLATRESIKSESDELRSELARLDAGDPEMVKEYSNYEASTINMYRGMVAFADKFAAMSFEEQEQELNAINRMNRKSSSGLVGFVVVL
ncbi:MAG: hypothetical protein EAZ92_08455 [Candidatus Kapaibacterium sp.]|nr:MAG: hypothetical protein EAZ92_08455 [Candidatus Kapabacteria bacterium]